MVVRKETTVQFTRPAYGCYAHLSIGGLLSNFLEMHNAKNPDNRPVQSLNEQKTSQPRYSRLTMQVTGDLSVQVIANPDYEFLMDTKTVALGYGVATSTISSHKFNNGDEFKEGKHFVQGKGIQNLDTLENSQPHQIFWTKQGVIRLGFFIKSERAKIFRDWAEGVIIQAIAPKVSLPAAKRRNHNRLTNQRLVDILADIALIDNKELRLSLVSKLLPENTSVQATLFTSQQITGGVA